MGIFTEHWYCPDPIKESERKPAAGAGPVMAHIDHGSFEEWDKACYLNEIDAWETWGRRDRVNVTHWIELPPHPEAGKW